MDEIEQMQKYIGTPDGTCEKCGKERMKDQLGVFWCGSCGYSNKKELEQFIINLVRIKPKRSKFYNDSNNL